MTTPRRTGRLFAVLATAVLALVWIRTSWVADDAFVTFRSVEQLVEGNGPRWNPHERVQAFTHPLFFGAVAAGRVVFSEPASAASALSFFLTLGLFLVLARSLRWRPWRVGLLLGLLLASRAFVDYSSSGLEDPLSHFLLALFALGFLAPPTEETSAKGDTDDADLALLRRSAWLGGLLLLCRHDLLLVILPPIAWLVLRIVRRRRTARPALRTLAPGFLPFLAWTLFALVYYGFPFPNTAYAKLNTGIDGWVLWRHGVDYLLNAARWDPATPLVIAAGAWLGWQARDRDTAALSLGVVLYLLYVVRIGGDFMAGRFLSEPFVVAAVLVAHLVPRSVLKAILAVGAAYLVAWPLSPLHLARGDAYASYRPDDPREHGIADERSFYTGPRSFDAFERRWPVAVWRARPDPQEHFEVGFAAYALGTDRIVVDRFGLADPLLARLPADEGWERVGHFRRPVPEGYIESLRTGENRIANEHVRSLYERIRRVTRGPLFSLTRWRDIAWLNLAYRRPGCVDPPCRELVMHRLPPPLFSPLLPPGEGEVTSIVADGPSVTIEGRLPFDDLLPEQRVRVFVPLHAEETSLRSRGAEFTVELRFSDEATARRARPVICVAAAAASREWRLLTSPNPACRALGAAEES